MACAPPFLGTQLTVNLVDPFQPHQYFSLLRGSSVFLSASLSSLSWLRGLASHGRPGALAAGASPHLAGADAALASAVSSPFATQLITSGNASAAMDVVPACCSCLQFRLSFEPILRGATFRASNDRRSSRQ